MRIGNFLFGPLIDMHLPPYQWWNSKRKEYTLKFFAFFLPAQVFLFMASFSLGRINAENFLEKVLGALVVDAVLICVLNLLYFLWPTLELLFFKNINLLYRRYCFALLNLFSVSLFVMALSFVFYIKRNSF